jgi:RNA polymerase sigma-70 factor (ECF subfamily)
MADGLGETLDSPAGLDRPTVNAEAVVETDDDARLVRAARAGDRIAFGHLYDRYARVVHGVLLARIPLGDVDDLVQDVFLRALPRLHTLRQPERFGAWLIAIARNCANDYHRRKPEEVTTNAEPDDGVDISGVPERRADSEAATILAAIGSLPEAYRETLLLRLVEGMTGPEIAVRTGLTSGSVRVNLHRGMQQLRAKLANEYVRNSSRTEPTKE